MSAGLDDFLQTRGLVADATAAMRGLQEQLHACPSDELGDLLAEVSALVRQADAARLAVTREAMSRGVVASSDAACPADWVVQMSGPATQAREALALVAATTGMPGYQPVDEAVLEGRIPVGIADAVVREFAKLRLAIPEAMHQDALCGLVTLAEDGHSPGQLARFRDRLIGRYGSDGQLDRRHQRLRARGGMSGFGQDLDGVFHAVLCLDPESHAIIAPVIEALAAPAPGTRHPAPGTRHRRGWQSHPRQALRRSTPPGRLGRGVRHLPRSGSTRATRGQHPAGGHHAPDGPARRNRMRTDPARRRALPCLRAEAGLRRRDHPMVLGSEGQPLDVGRESRLATPSQVAALWQRDKGCSFPGCSRPPGFCQAHHVDHWLEHIGPPNSTTLPSCAVFIIQPCTNVATPPRHPPPASPGTQSARADPRPLPSKEAQ